MYPRNQCHLFCQIEPIVLSVSFLISNFCKHNAFYFHFLLRLITNCFDWSYGLRVKNHSIRSQLIDITFFWIIFLIGEVVVRCKKIVSLSCSEIFYFDVYDEFLAFGSKYKLPTRLKCPSETVMYYFHTIKTKKRNFIELCKYQECEEIFISARLQISKFFARSARVVSVNLTFDKSTIEGPSEEVDFIYQPIITQLKK